MLLFFSCLWVCAAGLRSSDYFLGRPLCLGLYFSLALLRFSLFCSRLASLASAITLSRTCTGRDGRADWFLNSSMSCYVRLALLSGSPAKYSDGVVLHVLRNAMLQTDSSLGLGLRGLWGFS
jgi:hypothetical protein